jgi:hypothetical protein
LPKQPRSTLASSPPGQLGAVPSDVDQFRVRDLLNIDSYRSHVGPDNWPAFPASGGS